MLSTALASALVLVCAGVARRPSSVGLTVKGDDELGRALAISRSISTRVRNAWDLNVGLTSSSETAQGEFRVVLDEPTPGALAIRIEEAGSTLASREIPPGPSDEVETAAWLFVRSTIDRALRSAETIFATPEITARRSPPSIVAPSTAARSPIAPSPIVRDVGAREVTTRAVVAPVLPNLLPRVHQATPSQATALTAPGDWSLSVLASSSYAPETGVALGPTASIETLVNERTQIGAEVGYRYLPGNTTSPSIHHLPLGVTAGVSFGEALRLTLGGFASAEVKLAQAKAESKTVLGLSAGPKVRMTYGFISSRAFTVGFLVDLGLAFSLRRQRYLLDGATVDESPWSFRVASGLEWQWR